MIFLHLFDTTLRLLVFTWLLHFKHWLLSSSSVRLFSSARKTLTVELITRLDPNPGNLIARVFSSSL